jgi:transposase-like protein
VWVEFVPFLPLDAEIRKAIRSTNAIETVRIRLRKDIRTLRRCPCSNHDQPLTGQTLKAGISLSEGWMRWRPYTKEAATTGFPLLGQ